MGDLVTFDDSATEEFISTVSHHAGKPPYVVAEDHTNFWLRIQLLNGSTDGWFVGRFQPYRKPVHLEEDLFTL
jgi:hypothetical protein